MEESIHPEEQLKLELENFEGPLDLLLHLINQLEIDIYDIPIAQITDQYMRYLEHMKTKQIDVASEYFVMAATLMRIKSEMLVPRNENQADLEEDFYDEVNFISRPVKYGWAGIYSRCAGIAARAREDVAQWTLAKDG